MEISDYTEQFAELGAELFYSMAYLAFNIADVSGTQVASYIPDLEGVDVLEEADVEEALTWLHTIRIPGDRSEAKLPRLTPETEKTNKLILEKGKNAGILNYDGRYVSFIDLELQMFFCANCLILQPLPIIIDRANSPEYHKAWNMAGIIKPDLTRNLLSLYKDYPEHRASIVRVLAVLKNDEAYEKLIQIMEDKNEDIKVRYTAIINLKFSTDLQLMKKLFSLLKQEPELTSAIESRFYRFGEPALTLLCDEFIKSDARVRKAIIIILGELKNKKALGILHSGLRDEAIDVRVAAAEALKFSSDEITVNLLIEALKDPKDTAILTAFWAINVLDYFGNSAAIEPLIGLLQHNDSMIRVNSIKALAQFNTPRVVNAIASVLNDPIPHVHKAVIEALVRLKAPQITNILIEIANDVTKDEELRWEAIVNLSEVASDESLAYLISVAQKGLDKTIRIPSIRFLPHTGNELVLKTLNSLAHDPDPEVRLEAVISLTRSGNTDFLPFLLDKARDITIYGDDPQRQEYIFLALARCRSKEAVQVLIENFPHFANSCWLQLEIIEAFEEFNNPFAIPFLQELKHTQKLKVSLGKTVRLFAINALKKITKND